MDSDTLIVGFLLSLLANIVSAICKFLLRSRNRERLKSRFRTIYYSSFEQTERVHYFVLELLLFKLPSYLDHMYAKSIHFAKPLSLLFEDLKSHILVSFDRYRFNSTISDSLISLPQLLSVNNGWKDSIIQNIINRGCMSETALAQEIGPGIRAADLRPELDSLVIEGLLLRRKSGEPGCWHGIQMYELAR